MHRFLPFMYNIIISCFRVPSIALTQSCTLFYIILQSTQCFLLLPGFKKMRLLGINMDHCEACCVSFSP